MNYYEIIKKLIGPINPIGESNQDTHRLNNIDATIEVVGELLSDIKWAANAQGSHEASVAKIGKRAQAFLDELKEI